MFSRSRLGRRLQLAVQQQCLLKSPRSCHYAVDATSGSTSFSYETTDVGGIKVASRDIAGPTTKLTLIAKAGTRYEPAPGLTLGLEQFAFKNTNKRSALRICRETELLGGNLSVYHNRESLVIEARFLREDLPYFTELLGEVISETKYTTHEFNEQVIDNIKRQQHRLLENIPEVAINSAHNVAFHRGLGSPLVPALSAPISSYLNESSVKNFASSAFVKPNIAVIANGTTQVDLTKRIGEFLGGVPSSSSFKLPAEATKYYGGEERISHVTVSPWANSIVIAFPGSSSFTASSTYKPEMSVLAALLGGESTIKWSPGFSILSKAISSFGNVRATTNNHAHSDAGLLAMQLSGPAQVVRDASIASVKALKTIAAGEISKEDFTKAIAIAKFRALEQGESLEAGVVASGASLLHSGQLYQINEVGKSVQSVTLEKLKSAAKGLLSGKATVSAVGDLFVLPYAEELGLNV